MVIKFYPIELEAVQNFTRKIEWLTAQTLTTSESRYKYHFYHLLGA